MTVDAAGPFLYNALMYHALMKPAAFCFLLLLLFARPAHLTADAAPEAAAPPRIVSLSDALRAMPAASVGDGSVLLTVQPERIMPAPGPASIPETTPAGVELPPDVPTPDNIAAQYGRLPQWFGHVLALAPPTMTVLNTSPALADLPLSVLAGQHPIPFLLGTLTPQQLQQMAGAGLALSDLTPDQQALLKAALPQPFEIVPAGAEPTYYTQDDLKKTGAEREAIDQRVHAAQAAYNQAKQTISDETLYSSLRLHGYLAPDFSFDTPSGSGIGVRYGKGDVDGLETTGASKLVDGGRRDMFAQGSDQITAYLRAQIPNAPKESDLEWNRRDMERPVLLQNFKTVSDLVTQLAQATKLELYTDPRFGQQSLLVEGDLKTAQPAGDIMQALGLCVCGTWRQVGPAYVLTDDVQGLGARQEFLREMVQTWSNRMSEAGKAVGGHLQEMDWMHTLHFADGDIGALTPDQLETIHSEYKNNGGHLHWKDLPAPLQAGLRGQLTRHYDGDNMDNFEKAGNSVAQSLTPDYKVWVSINLRLAVELPNTGAMSLGDFYRVQTPSQEPPEVSKPPVQAGSISVDKPQRGILCAPKTADEARVVVSRLAKMGFNLLYLDVFTGGRTYFPNTALPPSSDKAAGVLQAVLDAARPLHMPVYAVLDTLCWRKDGASLHPQPWPKGYEEDLTVGGESPDHSVQRQLEAHSIRNDTDRDYEMAENGSEGWASPLDPHVRTLLPALVKTLAATKGLAGIAFQDTAPRGYLGLDYDYDDEGISLGYAPSNRLAYLRTNHADPVDLSSGYDSLQLFLPSEGWSTQFDVSLPTFPSNMIMGRPGLWSQMRGDADKSLLALCFASAHAASPTLPLLMRERRMGETFDPWTDPKKLNQYASTDSLANPFHQITADSVLCISYGPVERAKPRRLVWVVKNRNDADGKRAGSLVFDLVTGGSPDSLTATLDRLGALLKKPEMKK